jgi:acyl-CoA synthetase (AMP-forming)/AMP-acid ligase II
MREPRTLFEALAEAAGADAGYSFVSDGGETLRSYAEIASESFRVARALADAGLQRGDLVALVLSDAEAFLTALFGASAGGFIPASLYPPATSADLARYVELTASVLRTSGARAVLTTRGLVSHFDALRATCPSLSLVLAREDLDAPPIEPRDRPAVDDVAFVQFTSGSTSAPKGVVLSHRNLAANVDAINGPAGLATGDGDVAVSWLPLNHDMGLVGMALAPVYSARTAVLLPPPMFVKRPAEWLRAISRHRGTISFAPNFAYDLCVRRIKERELMDLDLSSWRAAGCGAEPIHAPTLEAFAAKFAPAGFRATSFLPSYGLAEHVLAATFAPRNRRVRAEHVPPGERPKLDDASGARSEEAVPIVSCGFPLPAHRLRIVDDDDHTLPERRVGEIALAGPSVMLGYYNQQQLTAETIRDGWLHTGDFGFISDGELFVCGRVKDIIIVNGRKYHPQDLEWAIGDLSGVRRGRVVAFGTVVRGQADRVVIVAEPSGTVAAAALTDSIRRRIGDVFGLYVDDVALVPSGTVGRTTSGKVQRLATKARYERGELAPVGAER